MPDFPFTEEREVTRWSNFHGTIEDVPVPVYCTPDVPSELGDNPPPSYKRHGDALSAIVNYCVDANPPKRLRVVGSRWSLSNIVRPSDVLIDPGNLNRMLLVNPDWLTSAYRNGRYVQGYRPVFVQSGAEIGYINGRLGQIRLALQTSGASDGHRIAGCIATGSHGAAIGIGAVHDTVLGFHIIVGGGRSLFLHRGTHPCFTPALATWFEQVTGVPTDDRPEDDPFLAAQVSLGSLGVVHGVVIEAAPLYRLRRVVSVWDSSERELWDALTTLNTQPLHEDIDDAPYHVELVINPHKRLRDDDAFLSLMWETDAGDELPLPRGMVDPEVASDVLTFVGHLSDLFDGPISTGIFRKVITEQLERRYRPGAKQPRFPGEVFGPSSLPPGQGTSTELVVAAEDAERATNVILEVLKRRARYGELLLGVVALRFTASTQALLGLNAKAPSCFIELPSVKNREVLDLYDRIWRALDTENIAFTCHWGQVGGFDRGRIDRYFGAERVNRWLAARASILTTPNERAAFASPILEEAGLI